MTDRPQKSRLQAIVYLCASVATLCGQPVDTVTLPPHAGSISVRSVPTDGTISTYLVSPPVGTLVYSYEPGCWGYVANQFGSDGWKNPTQPILAGQGLLTLSPSGVAVDVPSSGTLASTREQTIFSGVNLLGLLDGESLPIVSGFARYFRVLGGNDGWSFGVHSYAFGSITDEATLIEHATNGLAFLYEEESSTRPVADCDADRVGSGGSILLNEYYPPVANPVRITSVASGGPIEGAHWKAQLFSSPTGDGGFAPHGPVMGIGTGAEAGYITVDELNPTYLPGAGDGFGVYVEMRVWDSNFGSTYDEAVAQLGARTGRSDVELISPGSLNNLSPPTPLNVRGFVVFFPVVITQNLEIVRQPQNIFVAEGLAARFEIEVATWAMSLDYVLERLDDSGEWNEIQSEMDGFGRPFLTSVRKEDAGEYRVAVTGFFDVIPPETITSNVVTLNIAIPPALQLADDQNESESIKIQVDCDPEFPCRVEVKQDSGDWESHTLIPEGSSSAQMELDVDPTKKTTFLRARSVLPTE